MAAPLHGGDAALPSRSLLAGGSQDLDVASLAALGDVAALAAVAALPHDSSATLETFAAADATPLICGPASADMPVCPAEVAPDASATADIATGSPTDPPEQPRTDGATASKATRPASRSKSKGGKHSKKPARSRRGKKSRPENTRFARSQGSSKLDLSRLDVGTARVDLFIGAASQTANIGLAGSHEQTAAAMTVAALGFLVGQPRGGWHGSHAAPRKTAAVLGLPAEGSILQIDVRVVQATAGDLQRLASGGEPLPLMLATATSQVSMAVEAGAGSVRMPVVRATGCFSMALCKPNGEQAFVPQQTGGPATLKRPLGSVLTLSQILERLLDELHLSCSRSTLSRLLRRHELKPWRYQYWIFPQAADFAERGGRILDLYAGFWEGKPLQADEYVLSWDEKTSIQARRRCHETEEARQRRLARVEWGYERGGALQYIACWDVHRGKVFGQCVKRCGIESFDGVLAEVMGQEPYKSGKRVFAIMDNGSSHRGQASIDRLEGRYENLKVVHTPVHASWLNQVEIYFSILERALLRPNDFRDLNHLQKAILAFQRAYNETAEPFAWRFTRAKLIALLKKLEAHKRLAS